MVVLPSRGSLEGWRIGLTGISSFFSQNSLTGWLLLFYMPQSRHYRITQSPKLERTQEDHWVQLLALHKNQTIWLRACWILLVFRTVTLVLKECTPQHLTVQRRKCCCSLWTGCIYLVFTWKWQVVGHLILWFASFQFGPVIRTWEVSLDTFVYCFVLYATYHNAWAWKWYWAYAMQNSMKLEYFIRE